MRLVWQFYSSIENFFLKEILVSTMASSSSSDELKLVIGSTTALNTLVELQNGDNVSSGRLNQY